MRSPWITVGLSTHRVETLPAAEAAMAGHCLVALEEPPTDRLELMLAGRITVDRYVEDAVPEFPELARHQCLVLRRLHRDGTRVVQVEPFLAELEAIHDLFDSGGRPEDLRPGTSRGRVYRAEKRWTKALLDYYAVAHGNDFDRTVDAVRAFAAADAERGRLRDVMRARALIDLLPDEGGLYVEAGPVHAGLVGDLRRLVGSRVPVRPVWLTAPVVRELSGKPYVVPPGDRLILKLARNIPVPTATARLLAARSLIQVAITVKDELFPTEEVPFPHVLDDVRTTRLAEALSYEDCEQLYSRARGMPSIEARRLVRESAETRAGDERGRIDVDS